MFSCRSATSIRCIPFALVASALALVVAPVTAWGANGPANYFDNNSTTAGFGTAAGTFNQDGNFWSTSSAGTAATGALPAGAQMTFGNVGTDLAGQTFTINMNAGNYAGIVFNSTSANVTLTGTANAHLVNTPQSWTVPTGSTLTQAQTWPADGGTGLNYNGASLTLSGGGTINFQSNVGFNSAGTMEQNMPGGTVNMQTGWTGTLRNQMNYTLTAGTLNFAAGSANVFNSSNNAHTVSINGGTINNTSGAAITLGMGSTGSYSIGGNFVFTGSNNLNLGTAAVALAATPQITVSGGTLTVGGVISGGSGITKTGAGTLAVNANYAYTGDTTVNQGVFLYTPTANTTLPGNIVINGGTYQLGSGVQVNLGTTATTKNISFGANGGTLNTGSTNFYPSSGTAPGFTISTTAGAPQSVFMASASSGNVGLNTDNDTTTFNVALGTDATTDLLMSAPLWNGGTVIKTGNGRMTQSATNNHTGSIQVQNGTLTFTGASNSSAYSVSNGATLEMNVAAGSRDMVAATFSGGGTFKKTGAGTLLWGASAATFNFGSGALIDVQGGTFLGGSSGNEVWTSNQSNLNVASGALFHGVEANVRVGALSGDGTIRSGWSGAGYSTFTFGVGNASGSFNGTLSHNDGNFFGHYTKEGSGTQIFTGTINTIASGAGTGMTISAGTVEIGGSGTFSGGSWPNAMINNGTFHYNSTANNTMSGVISGSGALIKGNTGTLSVTANYTYTGDTTVNQGVFLYTPTSNTTIPGNIVINGGTYQLGSSFQVNMGTTATPKNISFGANGGTLNTGSTNFYPSSGTAPGFTISTTAGAPQSVFMASASSGNVGLNTDNDTTTFNVALGTHATTDLLMSAPLWNGGTVIKTGNGRMTNTATNNHTGSIQVQNGTLTFTGTSNSSAYSVSNGATLVFNVAAGSNDMGTTTISGLGTLRKTGAGTLLWGASAATFNLGSGALIDVQDGIFIGGASANEVWTSNLADLNVGASGIFRGVEANVRVDALTGSGIIRSGHSHASYNNFTFGVDNGSGTFSGALTDDATAGNFVKVGTGTQTFTGTNTHSGTTTVQGGTLELGTGGSMANTSTITVGISGNGTGDRLLLTNAAAHQLGSGDLIVGSTEAGTVDHNAGTVTVGDIDAPLENVRIGVGAAGIYNINNGATTTLNVGANATTGRGNLIVGDGNTGTLNVGTGATINTGDLLVGNGVGTGTVNQGGGTINVLNPSTYTLNASDAGGTALVAQSGGTTNVTGGMVLGNGTGAATQNQYNLSGGILDFGDTTGVTAGSHHSAGTTPSALTINSDGTFNFTGGSLQDVTTINTNNGGGVGSGTFTQSGGFFFVGQDEPTHFAGAGNNPGAPDNTARTTTINGGFSLLPNGRLHIDAFGPESTPSDYSDVEPIDLLRVTGIANLNAVVDFDDEYGAEFGDVHTLVLAPSIVLGPNFALDGGFFRVVPTGPTGPGFALQAIVPEPASVAVWTIIGLVGCAGAWRLRQRKR